METVTLNNGVEMPALGLGVFQTPPTGPGTPCARHSARGTGAVLRCDEFTSLVRGARSTRALTCHPRTLGSTTCRSSERRFALLCVDRLQAADAQVRGARALTATPSGVSL